MVVEGDGKVNNRGQVFAAVLVLVTLFMCGVVWVLYGVEQSNADSSLVSPRAVLEMRDDLEIFEVREKALVEFTAKSVEGKFGSDEFILEFRNRFLDDVIADEQMSDFIFRDLVFGGRDFEDDARREGREFLDKNLYSEVISRNGDLIFRRNTMGKKIFLRAPESGRINFPVWFEYDFAREYVVSESEAGGE
ncbi:MAG: hypothetical protein V1889_00550 [archaeon]